MTNEPDEKPPEKQNYRWPWFVLAAFVVAVVLAVLWMTAEVRRQQRYQQLDTPMFPQAEGAKTNSTR